MDSQSQTNQNPTATAIFQSIFTFLLNPWTGVLQKLTGYQLLKKFPHFLETEISIPLLQEPPIVTVLEQINSVHIHPFQFLKIHFIIILHLCLVLPMDLFLPGSSPKPCMHLSSPHTCFMLQTSHFPRFCHMKDIWCGVEVIKPLIMYFSQVLCYLFSPRDKYSPRHPILKHHQPMFLPSYERPSFKSKKTTG